MRKNIVFLAIACLGVFVSCKKNYTCVCGYYRWTVLYSNETDYNQSFINYTYKAKTKDKAQQACVKDHNQPLVQEDAQTRTQIDCNIK
ncbi:MAG TPA: hypothetical protein VN026_01070 [Bacteroidia bacterium]|jgi:hypothetical protein|nr:hypothetical protein [Bacteroidia bacterium]